MTTDTKKLEGKLLRSLYSGQFDLLESLSVAGGLEGTSNSIDASPKTIEFKMTIDMMPGLATPAETSAALLRSMEEHFAPTTYVPDFIPATRASKTFDRYFGPATTSGVTVGTTEAPSIVKASSYEVRRRPLKEHRATPVSRPRRIPRLGRFHALQRWEGKVVNSNGETFLAGLTDLSLPGPAEEAEFELSDVAAADHPLIRPGAIFYWSVGYYDSPAGQRSRSSRIRFRRLPAPDDEDIAAARLRGARIAASLGADQRDG